MSVVKYERSVIITMTLHWHGSQIFSLGKYINDTPTKTGLRIDGDFWAPGVVNSETFGPLESLRLMAVTASTDPKLVYRCRAIMRARITIAYHLTLFLWKDDYTNNKHIPVPTVEELNKKGMEILG